MAPSTHPLESRRARGGIRDAWSSQTLEKSSTTPRSGPGRAEAQHMSKARQGPEAEPQQIFQAGDEPHPSSTPPPRYHLHMREPLPDSCAKHGVPCRQGMS
eukprot:7704105-Pyramimonas_sp.AAC.1